MITTGIHKILHRVFRLKIVCKMSSTKKHVIVDVDVGTDDAFALAILLDGEKNGLVKIEAINCTMGNASLENVTKNVVRLLETFQRTDIPVYKGAREALIPLSTPIHQFHGKDGFGDLEYEKDPDLSIVQNIPAAVAMRDIVVRNPGKISLICVGPLTNVALAMKLFEDFAPNVKEMYIMGGNYTAMGNVKETTAEFNFYVDPEAAHIVFENIQFPITVATWESCFMSDITYVWRFDVLGLKNTPFMQLLNRAEKSIYPKDKQSSLGIWYPCDSIAVISMLYPSESIIRYSKDHATVELHGKKTRGQIVIDHSKKNIPNVIFLHEMNYEFIKKILLKAADYV